MKFKINLQNLINREKDVRQWAWAYHKLVVEMISQQRIR